MEETMQYKIFILSMKEDGNILEKTDFFFFDKLSLFPSPLPFEAHKEGKISYGTFSKVYTFWH